VELSALLKIASVAWVGGVILIGLLINGDRLYSWVGKKFYDERDRMHAKLNIMFVDITLERLAYLYGGYLVFLYALGMFLLAPSLGGGGAFWCDAGAHWMEASF